MGTEPIDLAACEREPLHVPGSVQPHGALLALDGEGRMVQVSASWETLFGEPADALLGRSLATFAPPALLAAAEALSTSAPGILHEIPEIEMAGQTLAATLHRNPQGIRVIELEPIDPQPAGRVSEIDRSVNKEVIGLGRLSVEKGLFEQTVRVVAGLTGFDRVMVYRFDPEYHGQVVAERCAREDVPPYLDQKFPASDIPSQARALYVRNPYRSIADAGYAPAPILPAMHPETGAPLDLTDSLLRSVSPMHIEYLENIGVAASMSLSLLVGGRLWGLIACHHMAPLRVLPDRRAACRLVADVVSRQIALGEHTRAQEQSLRTYEAAAGLLERMTLEEDIAGALCSSQPNALDVVPAAGVVASVGGAVRTLGETPGDEAMAPLIHWFSNERSEDVLETNELGSLTSLGEGIEGPASGVLAISLSDSRRDVVMWLRHEQVRTHVWGGDPNRVAALANESRVRLSPRKSFQTWTETVRGRSAGWEPHEVEAAAHLQRALTRLLRATRKLFHERDERRKAQSELEDYAHKLESTVNELRQMHFAASHDLQEPLRTIMSYSDLVMERTGDQIEPEVRRYLEIVTESAVHLKQLVGDLLVYARIEQEDRKFEPVSLAECAQRAAVFLDENVREANAEIEYEVLPTVRGNYNQICQLFQNLIGNALKYRAGRPTRIRVTADREADGWRIGVHDNGIGIAAEHRERIFGMFRRLHRQDEYPGSGIGLALCKRIVERHGGRIWVEGPADGTAEGSTFWFVLPATDDATPRSDA